MVPIILADLMAESPLANPGAMAGQIRSWAHELGFQRCGFAHADLTRDEQNLQRWLAERRHGEMHYMARHGLRRSRPAELIDGTLSIVSVRMDYLPAETQSPLALLDHPSKAYVSRYALGRDYHRLMRRRLQRLADRMQSAFGAFGYRVFVDSAPVLEKPLARNAGLGWIGKHTNLIDKDAGSWFFLGELYTDLELPADEPVADLCGSCRRCLDVCPTRAITAPYQLDARRCISYLTIELKGSIPVEFRKAIGNRIYGCDDCQLVCPWNKFARPTAEPDFAPRQRLGERELVDLFDWSEEQWHRNMAGSAIRRIGYEGWLRNIAVALGNARTTRGIIAALRARADHPSALVREHVNWALAQHHTESAREE